MRVRGGVARHHPRFHSLTLIASFDINLDILLNSGLIILVHDEVTCASDP